MTKPIHHSCAKCGARFTGRASRKYCSLDCSRSDRPAPWNKGTKGGKGRPRNRVTKACEGCGTKFETEASRSDSRRFCCMSCYHKARWGGVGSSESSCENCGQTFTYFDCESRRFCSHSCYVASDVVGKGGADHPNWKGGTSKHYRRGANWKVLAESVRARDNYACRECGKSQSSLSGKRQKLDVHHIVPWAVSACNNPDNLVTLCRSCHHKAEPSPAEVARLHDCAIHRKTFLEQARRAWGLL